LIPLDEYRRQMSATLAEIKATPRLPGVDEIRLPSERAFSERARNRREGIEIDRRVHAALKALPAGRLPAKT
jgi:LDH2 family malate/lactate/ureidoglycolate dehydrogenase